MAQLLAREVLLGCFKEHTLIYFSEAFRVSLWTK